jgi:hypothetical protein
MARDNAALRPVVGCKVVNGLLGMLDTSAETKGILNAS